MRFVRMAMGMRLRRLWVAGACSTVLNYLHIRWSMDPLSRVKCVPVLQPYSTVQP